MWRGPAESPRVVFVVGNSRSGTTMLARILGGHSQVHTFEELHFFEQLWAPSVPAVELTREQAVVLATRLLGVVHGGYHSPQPADAHRLEAGHVVASRASWTAPEVYAATLASLAPPGTSVVCEQTPRNLYYLAELLELLPDAVAVHVARDPRDVLLSQKNRWRRRQLGSRVPLRNAVRTWAGYHPVTISLLWRSGVRAGRRLDGHPRVVQVRFEDLLANPTDVVVCLCRRLGIDFEPSMLDIPQIGSSLQIDAPDRRGIDQSATGRWRSGLTATEVLLCQQITRPEALRLGYTPEPVPPQPIGLLAASVTLILKSGLAAVLNVQRVRRLGPALRRRLGW